MKTKTVIKIVLAVAIVGLIIYGIASASQKKKSGASTVNPTEVADSSAVTPVSEEDHIFGDKNAPITLIEYSDYQCPYCVKHYPTMKQLLSQYSGQVRWVFRSYPLPFHKAAKKASEAAEAAGAQGKFWEYSDKLIANSNADGKGLEAADLTRYAEDLGLDMKQFQTDLSSGKYASKVERDLASGKQAGVDGTPATFLVDKNGKAELISGALPLAEFQAKIDAALK